MDFSWTADQMALRNAVIDFAHRALQDDLMRRHKAAEFSRELWIRRAEWSGSAAAS